MLPAEEQKHREMKGLKGPWINRVRETERDGDRRRDKFVNVGEFYANQNASGRNWIDLQPIRATKLETYTRQLQ